MEKEQIVFVLDDDRTILKYLAHLLDGMVYPYKVFREPKEFLDFYKEEMAGCLVCDVVMPEMSGLELQNYLLRRGMMIPIIFISSHGDLSMVGQALNKGAINFLEKPIDPEELKSSISQAMARDMVNRREHERQQQLHDVLGRLDEQERLVLDALVKGMSTRMIARTVKMDLGLVTLLSKGIFEKFSVHNIDELMRLLLILRMPECSAVGH